MVAVLPGAGGVLRGVVMAAVAAPAGRRGAAVAVAAAAVQGGQLAGLDGVQQAGRCRVDAFIKSLLWVGKSRRAQGAAARVGFS